MTDLHLERDLNISAAQLWPLIATPAGLLQWWGPEGMTVPDHALEFTRPGPWHSVMQNAEGQRFKVTGEVTQVVPGQSVTLTWAWHDENDTRGHESIVRFQIEPLAANRCKFSLNHTGLADAESATNHDGGWTSSLSKLERLAKTT